MNKITLSVLIFVCAFLLLACKSETHEANEYIDEYFSLAYVDFNERIAYKEIIHVQYIYLYAMPKSEKLGEETRFFKFFIKYVNLDDEVKNDFIMVTKFGDEEISLPTMIGYETAFDYNDQEISEMIKQNERQYSLLKGISKRFTMESRKMEDSLLQSYINPS